MSDPPLTKSALKKLAKLEAKKKKAEEVAARLAAEQAAATKVDPSIGGQLPLHVSTNEQLALLPAPTACALPLSDPSVVRISSVTAGTTDVELVARAESVRSTGNLTFMVLRQGGHTMQAVVAKSETVPKALVKFASAITPESIVKVVGSVVKPEEEIKSCTRSQVELHVSKCFVIQASEVPLPLQMADLSVPENELVAAEEAFKKARDEEGVSEEDLEKIRAQMRRVPWATRFDARPVDLRTRANRGIFRVGSMLGALFREFLTKNDFMEIHSPKLIGAASEGGADVFEVKYFDRKAYLAQSPQFYKQMAICGDFERVFEVGSVFRAENSNTPRHMTEFIGLDLEMTFQNHYHEVLNFIDQMFQYIFENLQTRCADEIAAVHEQYPAEPLEFKWPSPIVEFPEGVKMLREAGADIQDDLADLSTEHEKLLGRLVKAKYGSDFYRLDKFPLDARAFYTMPDSERPGYSNSYDLMLRTQEISSGAQRVHDYETLVERVKAKGVEVDQVRGYVDSFRYGCQPHAGCGIGKDRLIALFLGVPNVQLCSFCPRTPARVHP
jgi:aspartyl-tRNA synthetase